MSKRITVNGFIKAVKASGVVPRRCLWIKEGADTVEACAIGALTVAAGRKDYAKYAREADGLGLTSEYITGFITGFDGRRPHTRQSRLAEQYSLGHEDGLACAVAAFDQKLHEDYAAADVDLTPYLDPSDDDEQDVSAYVYTGNWN